MKLGWTVLLPASLANVFATGIVWLALQRGGDSLASGLKVAADLAQAFVATSILAIFLWMLVALIRGTPLRLHQIVGSSAKFAAAAGGTKTAPIRA